MIPVVVYLLEMASIIDFNKTHFVNSLTDIVQNKEARPPFTYAALIRQVRNLLFYFTLVYPPMTKC